HRARPHLPTGGGHRARARGAGRRPGRRRGVHPAADRHWPRLAGLLAGLAGRRAAAGRRGRHRPGAARGRSRRDDGAGGGGRAGGRVSLLEQTWGTWLNVATVLVGGGLGLLVRGRLPARVTAVVMQAIGLVTLLIGVLNAMDLSRVASPPGVLVGLLALAIGGALGEWGGIEDGLERLGARLKRALGGPARLTRGLGAAGQAVCVGPLLAL